MFQRAIKREASGRVALVGSSGSGKSYTMLTLARALAGPTGTIAAVDTEHGSLSKYAHTPGCGGPGVCKDPSHFDFDVADLDSFSPDNFLKTLEEAVQGGYAVFCCDSLSHFWMGRDGALEFVDNARRRSSSRDDMSGWKDFSPVERRMVDAMISAPLHVVVTMRTKTDYQEQEYTNARGEKKTKRVKVGLAPVQRQGLEYEFDLVGYMDEDNCLIVDKSRCFALGGKSIPKPKAADFTPFVDWLRGTAPEQAKSALPAKPQPAPAQQSAARETQPPKEKPPSELKRVGEQIAVERDRLFEVRAITTQPERDALWAGLLARFDVGKVNELNLRRRKELLAELKRLQSEKPAAPTGARASSKQLAEVYELREKLGWTMTQLQAHIQATYGKDVRSLLIPSDLSEEQANEMIDQLNYELERAGIEGDGAK